MDVRLIKMCIQFVYAEIYLTQGSLTLASNCCYQKHMLPNKGLDSPLVDVHVLKSFRSLSFLHFSS